MGDIISTIAFPAPEMTREYYNGGLVRRSDLIWITTTVEERIPAVYKRYDSDGYMQAGSTSRPTILYSHGNAEDIGLHLPFIDCLSEATGCDIFSYEYVGYSLSKLNGDKPNEEACVRSIYAAWRHLTEKEKVPPEKIVMFGRSIGTGPTVDLASRASLPDCPFSPHDAAGVLLQSPLESGARAALGYWTSICGYPLDIFRNYEKVPNIPSMVAIVHGTEDRVVPCHNGRALHKLCKNPYEPLWLKGKGHNDMPERDVCAYAKKFVAHAVKKASSR